MDNRLGANCVPSAVRRRSEVSARRHAGLLPPPQQDRRPCGPDPAIAYSPAMETQNEPIPVQRCWELLGTASVGRLALSVRALPVIMPVQYYLSGQRLAVCLGHHQIPDRALDQTVVAFTADAIDPVARSGWVVQVQGRAALAGPGFGTGCGYPAAAQVAEIMPAILTGYYVHMCPFIDSLLQGTGGGRTPRAGLCPERPSPAARRRADQAEGDRTRRS